MYVIHLIILLNILGVMIDNNRFVLYCIIYLTLYTFSFEINESRLSDTKVSDVVSLRVLYTF